MPELAEVETIVNGLKPFLEHQSIKQIILRHHQLRWPIPNLDKIINEKIMKVSRRAKYILIEFQSGTLLIHLGMSGSLRIFDTFRPAQKHDHVDFILSDSTILRYNDPRRFGAILWSHSPVAENSLLINLGPEPLSKAFDANYLKNRIGTRKTAIKTLLMNQNIVSGIGNIYATEALFFAHIHPQKPAHLLSAENIQDLVQAIKKVLNEAIQAGGTSLKDFKNTEGKPGYFKQKLQVYGRKGLKCFYCGTPLESLKIGQRSTVFCPSCQK